MLLRSNYHTSWTRKGPEVKNYFVYNGVRARINGGFTFATEIANPATPANNSDAVLRKLSLAGALHMNKVFDPSANTNVLTAFLAMSDKGYLIYGQELIGLDCNLIVMSLPVN